MIPTHNRLAQRTAALVVFDTALIMAAVWLGAVLRLGVMDASELIFSPDGVLRAALIALVCQLCLYFCDLYDLSAATGVRDVFERILRAMSVTTIILAAIYFWFPGVVIGRGVYLVAALVALTAVLLWRLVFEWFITRVYARERLLLVGTTPGAVMLARELRDRGVELGIEIVGFIEPDPTRVGEPFMEPGIIGTVADIPSIVRARDVDCVVVSLADARGKLPMNQLLEMKLNGVTFDHLASVYERFTGKIAVEDLRPSWLIFSPGFRKTRSLTTAKRAMDIAAAAIGLVIAAPIMAALAALVKLTSPGPAFYRQQRVGLYGRMFTIRKFRSMQADAEAATGPVWSQENDPRITRVGRLLRRTRLDELPQLLNVLAGDMSLVGPRPERPAFVQTLTGQIPFYGRRHAVRPGLTGWAQVRYTYGASVEDAMQKLQYDLYYIKHMSVAFDIFIVLNTVKTVILRKGA